MVIGDLTGYSSFGLGGVQSQRVPNIDRNAVTLDAKLDPKKPNAYTVQFPAPVITPPEKLSDIKSASKRAPQNTDPVSQTFNMIADYGPRIHKIDIFV